MIAPALLSLLLLGADPTSADPQIPLLKQFREEFVVITPGQGKFPAKYMRGEKAQANSLPASEVSLRDSFEIAKYEVTQELWQQVMGENPSKWKGKRNSVEMLSLPEARRFCERVTQDLRKHHLLDEQHQVVLPTESQWEYCARAGTTTLYHFGDDAKQLGEYGWFTGNAAGNDPPVGAKKPNAFGLYDMAGYLWEWCEDDYQDSYEGVPTDGSPFKAAAEKKALGVLRSGSWKDPAHKLTSGYRWGVSSEVRDDAVGLRCVIVQSEKAKPHPVANFVPVAQGKFFAKEPSLEKLWGEGEFTEGPAAAVDGSIYFSDIGNSILRFDPATKQTSVFRANSGRSNGLFFAADESLVACEGANTGGNRRISISKRNSSGSYDDATTLVDAWEGKRFNSPNDLVIAKNGNIYFSDPRYVGNDPRDLDFDGVFVILPGDKPTVKLATKAAKKPNGLVISPDGKYLYLAENDPAGKKQLLRLAIQSDGMLKPPQVMFDFFGGRGIDGMTIDAAGNIYATAGTQEHAGIYVFSPEGEHLAFLPTPGDPTNCCLSRAEGGAAGAPRSLYITSGVTAEGAVSPPAPTKYGLFRILLSETAEK